MLKTTYNQQKYLTTTNTINKILRLKFILLRQHIIINIKFKSRPTFSIINLFFIASNPKGQHTHI